MERGAKRAAGSENGVVDATSSVQKEGRAAGDKVEGTQRKKRRIKHDDLHLSALPNAYLYEKSYMHRDIVTQVLVSKQGFVITVSADGIVKFWKKMDKGIEFAKVFRAHMGPVKSASLSSDGNYLITTSSDKAVRVFFVPDFDMIAIVKLDFPSYACAWISSPKDVNHRIAAVSEQDNSIHIYSVYKGEEIASFSPHKSPITCMKYNPACDMVVSADSRGNVEYWSPETLKFTPENVNFAYKIATDLFDFRKCDTHAISIDFSPDYKMFAACGADRIVRVFHFSSGKLYRKYDEGLEVLNKKQVDGDPKHQLEAFDFGKRFAVEKQINEHIKDAPDQSKQTFNAIFDSSGRYLLYASMTGIKIVNLREDRLVAVLGKVESTERFMYIALLQENKFRAHVVESTSNEVALSDPTLFCTSFGRSRFFLFTRREPDEHDDIGRDIFNEPPPKEEQTAAAQSAVAGLASGAVIHTTKGDIKLKLFPDDTPKTVSNFVGLSRKQYYDGVVFHRVIKGFMIQTGDPGGDGTGGESLWGGEFEDEIVPHLKHDRPYTLSMANAGPNTNGSQFFITTVPAPWLDDKHTVFGRVTSGMEVVESIEKISVDEYDKPLEEVRIINVDIS